MTVAEDAEDDGFEQFKRDFATPEGRALYGYHGTSQVLADAMLHNERVSPNNRLRGDYNGWAARQRAVETEKRRAAETVRLTASVRRGLVLVVSGLIALSVGVTTLPSQTVESPLPGYETRYLGDDFLTQVCPVDLVPSYGIGWFLCVGVAIAGALVTAWGAARVLRHPGIGF